MIFSCAQQVSNLLGPPLLSASTVLYILRSIQKRRRICFRNSDCESDRLHHIAYRNKAICSAVLIGITAL